MRMLQRTILMCLFAPAVAVWAEESPISASNKFFYNGAQKILLRAAETMPEEHYGFKPVDTVRSFGQIVGHVADSQYVFCSVVLGEKNPAPKIEKTKTSKADLAAALKESFTYCDRAYDAMTDKSAAEKVKFFGGIDTTKIGVLSVNQTHSIEHYGNMVTYMRLKGLVPPSTERAQAPRKPSND